MAETVWLIVVSGGSFKICWGQKKPNSGGPVALAWAQVIGSRVPVEAVWQGDVPQRRKGGARFEVQSLLRAMGSAVSRLIPPGCKLFRGPCASKGWHWNGRANLPVIRLSQEYTGPRSERGLVNVRALELFFGTEKHRKQEEGGR